MRVRISLTSNHPDVTAPREAARWIPLTTQHYPILQRNLFYTGVTRGKHLGVLAGQRKALATAVKGARARTRWSRLRGWLRDSVGP
jgi:ATP-dependent exoDNAse (exonuclease V) alpha subunit